MFENPYPAFIYLHHPCVICSSHLILSRLLHPPLPTSSRVHYPPSISTILSQPPLLYCSVLLASRNLPHVCYAFKRPLYYQALLNPPLSLKSWRSGLSVTTICHTTPPAIQHNHDDETFAHFPPRRRCSQLLTTASPLEFSSS